MVLTPAELHEAFQHEVRVLSHLISKVTPEMADYRPTPKQRSTIELLRYLAMMGPTMVRYSLAKPGEDMNAVWGAEVKAVENLDLSQLAAKIAAQSADYTKLLGSLADTDYREVIQGFGTPMTRGAFLVTSVLGSHAAYRTQLFLYLKACGREELSTPNLWRGVDPQPKAS